MPLSKKQKRKAALEKRQRTIALNKARAWNIVPTDDGLALPQPRARHRVCVVGSKIYVVGGFRHGLATKDVCRAVDVYDTARPDEGWAEASSGRGFGKRHEFASAVVGNKIYVVGGSSAGSLDSTIVFDASNPKKGWKTLPQKMRRARSMHAACSIGSKIYVVGGCQQEIHGEGVGRPEVFDTVHPDEGWKYLGTSDLQTKERLGLSLASVGSKLFAMGGYVRGYQWHPSPSVFIPKPSVEVFDTARPEEGWREFPRMRSYRKFFGVAKIGSKLYAIGGDTGGGPRGFCDACDVSTTEPQWEMAHTMDIARHSFDVGVIDGKIFAIGGLDKDGNFVTEMETLNTSIGDSVVLETMEVASGNDRENDGKRQRCENN